MSVRTCKTWRGLVSVRTSKAWRGLVNVRSGKAWRGSMNLKTGKAWRGLVNVRSGNAWRGSRLKNWFSCKPSNFPPPDIWHSEILVLELFQLQSKPKKNRLFWNHSTLLVNVVQFVLVLFGVLVCIVNYVLYFVLCVVYCVLGFVLRVVLCMCVLRVEC